MAAPRLLFSVSGHGFGHATRSAALLAALARSGVPPECLQVRSQAPEWIFTRRVPGLACSAAPIDPGLLQPNGLDIDLSGTLAAHEDFVANWDDHVAREVDAIAAFGAMAVVADIPPVAFAAAARAGVPAYGVANFSWDWILDAYSDVDPHWARVVTRYSDAYASARRLFRLPLHGDLSAFPEVRDVPLLVNRSARSRAECRTALGIAANDERRLVLVSFGGFGGAEVRATRQEDLSHYLFTGTGAPPDRFPGKWIPVPGGTAQPHEDLVQAADALIGKPGYSTVAEALTHQTRFLYVPRKDFREMEPLLTGLDQLACARQISREDFEQGRWRPHLDALFAMPAPPPPPPHNGADVIAREILADLA